ncbi:SapC family protein [Sphingomonas hengshuiensis]|uniref:Peptidase n=1 Tax=Sphingomonas hengshuiensis TaxID=1609977 RepID=A0A7U4J6I0_9SPHN|nr:SapC family protein [Sphingomonas hengshuiensis]AJP71149.1 hypothetical protein TS85_03905 [Sphingomonas hengshuiensis]
MATSPDRGALPLFFRKPVALSSERHAHWRVRQGDVGFAAGSAAVPIVVGEFAAAARDYPILFADGTAAPVALLGLEARNLFIADGAWDPASYVPAYVRRYPFTTVVDPQGNHALVVDAESDRIVADSDISEGEALFAEGKPAVPLNNVIAFCQRFHIDAEATEAFAAALLASDILVERRADITLAAGQSLRIEGFRIVDEARFRALEADKVLDWHQKGWLGLVSFHLASLARFESLVSRHSALPA